MSRPRPVLRASWRALRHPGRESMALYGTEAGWQLRGRAEIRFPEGPTPFRYRIDCDRAWRPARAEVSLRSGSDLRTIEIVREREGVWTVGGFRDRDLDGCTDLDFAASPATNTLALNRLALAVGETAEILTAYVLFPDVVPIAARQRYTRVAERRYFFEGLHNNFSSTFDVDERNVVTTYAGGWERVHPEPRVKAPKARATSRPRRINP